MLNDTLDQQAIHNNLEIFERIVKELQGAKQEILVASAWFTDGELLELLTQKSKAGVKVEVIIADNKDNQKLDFKHLVNAGGKVYKIKSTGFGIMHQKFCVTDKNVVLHGSYNWTINAKKNNHESIIATNHKSTVDSFISNFENIKQKTEEMAPLPVNPLNKAKDFFSNLFLKDKKKSEAVTSETESVPVPQVAEVADKRTEYEKVLDSMIAAEVGNFDRELLHQQGYDRSKANNGDHQVIGKGLDSLYSVFIHDINVVDDKKARLITKIEEQKTKSIVALRENHELQLQTIDAEAEITKTNLSNKKTNLQSQISISEKEIENIKKINIPVFEEKNFEIADKIKKEERDFVKPAFKWFEFIPVTLLNLGLLVYLTLFYSSAAYILLFSEIDAKTQIFESGSEPLPMEVFNPKALSNAFNHGGIALIFILFFVFLPLTFALAGRFTKNRWISILLSSVGVIVVDAAIAYKVAESIHDVNLLIGKETENWHPAMALEDTNFYLVFVMGAAGLLFFKFAFDKFMSYFEERNSDINSEKSKKLIEHLKQDIDINNKAIIDLKEEAELLEKEIIQSKSEIIICDAELDTLPSKRLNAIERCKSEFTMKTHHIDVITDIYKSHIENDNLPISVDSMKDRINVYLEGWNDFLHTEYAIAKAVEKSRLAAGAATEWQNLKLHTNSVDRRIKA
jgi:NADH:ubiquinone oxidoreductase subunit 3 (subunit A)